MSAGQFGLAPAKFADRARDLNQPLLINSFTFPVDGGSIFIDSAHCLARLLLNTQRSEPNKNGAYFIADADIQAIARLIVLLDASVAWTASAPLTSTQAQSFIHLAFAAGISTNDVELLKTSLQNLVETFNDGTKRPWLAQPLDYRLASSLVATWKTWLHTLASAPSAPVSTPAPTSELLEQIAATERTPEWKQHYLDDLRRLVAGSFQAESAGLTANPLFQPSFVDELLSLIISADAHYIHLPRFTPDYVASPQSGVFAAAVGLVPRLAESLRSQRFGAITFIHCDPIVALLYQLPGELLFDVMTLSGREAGLFNSILAAAHRLTPAGQLIIDGQNKFTSKSTINNKLELFYEEFGLRSGDLESLTYLKLEKNEFYWLPGGYQAACFMVWKNSSPQSPRGVVTSALRQATLLWQCARQALNKAKFAKSQLTVQSLMKLMTLTPRGQWLKADPAEIVRTGLVSQATQFWARFGRKEVQQLFTLHCQEGEEAREKRNLLRVIQAKVSVLDDVKQKGSLFVVIAKMEDLASKSLKKLAESADDDSGVDFFRSIAFDSGLISMTLSTNYLIRRKATHGFALCSNNKYVTKPQPLADLIVTEFLPATFIKLAYPTAVQAIDGRLEGLEATAKGWKVVQVDQPTPASFFVDALFPKGVLPCTIAKVRFNIPEPNKLEVFLEPNENFKAANSEEKFVGHGFMADLPEVGTVKEKFLSAKKSRALGFISIEYRGPEPSVGAPTDLRPWPAVLGLGALFGCLGYEADLVLATGRADIDVAKLSSVSPPAQLRALLLHASLRVLAGERPSYRCSTPNTLTLCLGSSTKLLVDKRGQPWMECRPGLYKPDETIPESDSYTPFLIPDDGHSMLRRFLVFQTKESVAKFKLPDGNESIALPYEGDTQGLGPGAHGVISPEAINAFQQSQIPSKPAGPSCAACGKEQSNLMRCARCKSVFYCSRACQTRDWTSHRSICANIAENAAATQ